MFRRFPLLFLAAMLIVGSFSVSGCATQTNDTVGLTLASMETMPAPVQRQPRRVSQAYQFAAANADILQYMPCYCGCGGMGHESNYNCFWQADGSYESHATGCGICVDIAQDVMKGVQQGKSPTDIRTQIDKDYARFGEPTNTPLPVAAALP